MDWSKVDWANTDRENARIHGVSVTTIAVERRRRGIPSKQQQRSRPGSYPGVADVPYESDRIAQLLIQRHPEGCCYEMIAEHLGGSRERARQVAAEALVKIRRSLEDLGYSVEDLRRHAPGVWELLRLEA